MCSALSRRGAIHRPADYNGEVMLAADRGIIGAGFTEVLDAAARRSPPSTFGFDS